MSTEKLILEKIRNLNEGFSEEEFNIDGYNVVVSFQDNPYGGGVDEKHITINKDNKKLTMVTVSRMNPFFTMDSEDLAKKVLGSFVADRNQQDGLREYWDTKRVIEC